MNRELVDQVIEQIKNPPPGCNYNMNTWGTGIGGCGTSACLAGWTVSLADYEGYQKYLAFDRSDSWVAETAAEALGLDIKQANLMFHAYRATPEDHEIAFKMIEQNPNISLEELCHFYCDQAALRDSCDYDD